MAAMQDWVFALSTAMALAGGSTAAHAGEQLALPPGVTRLIFPGPFESIKADDVAAEGNRIAFFASSPSQGLGGIFVYSGASARSLAIEGVIQPLPGTINRTNLVMDGDRIAYGDLGDIDTALDRAKIHLFQFANGNWSHEATLPDSFGRDPSFGYGRVALSGELLLTAESSLGGGFVYVYSRESGSWQLIQTITTSGVPPVGTNNNFQNFGYSFAVSGNTIAVTARGRSNLWLYRRPGPGQPFQFLSVLDGDGTVSNTPLAGVNNGPFGGSFAIDGSTILMGLPGESSIALAAGAIRVFKETNPGSIPGSWAATQLVHPSDAGPLTGLWGTGSHFGYPIALAGDLAVVGALSDQASRGAVYLLRRDPPGPDGVWVEETKLITPEGRQSDYFGEGLAIHDGRIAMGAPFEKDLTVPYVGALYIADVPMQTALELSAFCFGNGGDQMGCKDCPCMNNGTVNTFGGCVNSHGRQAKLASIGRPSMTGDSLRLELIGIPDSTFAILASGGSPAPMSSTAPCPIGSGVTSVPLDGLLCITNGILRHDVRGADARGRIGVTNQGWGDPSPPVGGLVGQCAATAGQTRYWQAFYRDVISAGCGTGINTSNVVAAVLVP